MKCSISTRIYQQAARARQAGSIFALGLTLTLGMVLGAGAQNPNDTTVPTPYSWSNVHSGGAEPGAIPAASNVTPNALANFQMGTPTGILPNGKFDQISSFLLGNYDPTTPPGAITVANPNNFRDAAPFGILSWSSPYTFTFPTPTNSTNLTVDDVAGGNGTTYIETGTWTNTSDGTATTDEYESTGAVADLGLTPDIPATDGSTATATWTLTAPANTTTAAGTTTGSGFYVVTIHLPDSAAVPNDGTTPTTPSSVPITDAHYIIQDTTTAKNILANVRVSQTESNANQFLAGPFFIAAGASITVTLDNTTAVTPIAVGAVVIADSVSLQPGFGANVQSTPTAINASEFPEIQNAFYYGVGSQKTVGTGAPGTPDATPRGNVSIVDTPAVDYSNSTAVDAGHRIRQLVYYGRSENIILQDSNGNLVNDSGALLAAGSSPIIRTVGAIYCADGFTGSVVWRYQTPVVTSAQTTNGTTSYVLAKASAPVFSSPAIARINVEVPIYTKSATAGVPPTVAYALQTRLVVIVGDNNGLVYCLDAIGNRNGTSNSNAVSGNDQPLFNPTAGLGGVTTTGPFHAGTTPIYWIYRPDATQPKDIIKGTTKTVDATSDLPAPGAFGTASPVIYIDPTAAAGTIGTYPGDTAPQPSYSATNAYVYAGNNNGVLYKFLAAGGISSSAETYDASLSIQDPEYLYNADDPAQTMIPTTQPVWWMPLNGSATQQGGSPTTGGDYESITSTPAIRAVDSTATALTFRASGKEEIYFTSADDTDNLGRLYAIPGTGPTDVGGNALTPGSTGYNDAATTEWEFPNRYVRTGSNASPNQSTLHPALGSITGSPVVFTDPHGAFDLGTFVTGTKFEVNGNPSNPLPLPTRIFFAASSGDEPSGATTGSTIPTTRPSVEETGRIWSVEADVLASEGVSATTYTTFKYPGDVAWAFPDTVDPNSISTAETIASPATTINGITGITDFTSPSAYDPLGAFRNVTPAIGMVQFPSNVTANNVTAAAYTHKDQNAGRTFTLDNTNPGPLVPMLYVGSSGTGTGQQGPRFYGLDLDGASDAERTIFQDNSGAAATPPTAPTPGIVSPAGNIATSAALVVNSSTATQPGNGGVLFFSSGATLYQISATPVTARDSMATDVAVPVQPIVSGVGPYSAPSVAGANVFDLVSAFGGTAPTSGIFSTANVTDWVYFSDSGQGIAEGITPLNQNGGLGQNLNQIVPVNPIPPNAVLSQFPLYTYEFDGSTNHSGSSMDMTTANQIGQILPLFEWGQNVYIRIGNVIPPNPGDPAAGTDKPALRIYDPSTIAPDSNNDGGVDLSHAIFFSDGGPVTIQISDLDAGNNQPLQTDTGQVPAVVIGATGTQTTPPSNGFFKRTDPSVDNPAHFIAAKNGQPAHTNEQLGALLSNNGITVTSINGTLINQDNGWIGAYTYAIRDGSARRNTPGTTRRVVTATQVAKAYRLVQSTLNGPYDTPQFLQSVTLQTTITQGGEATSGINATTGKPTVVAITRIDQPTFGLLNPLAVHGGGVPLFTGSGTTAAIGNVLGPFAGVHPPSATGVSALTNDDLPALANGNRYPRSTADVPLNGVLANPPRRGMARGVIITATGDINHGSTGDNAAPAASSTAPTGNIANTTGNGGLSSTSTFGKYTLDLADRSALGLIGLTLQNVTVASAALLWNDNTNDATGQPNNGPGAVVNYLPWEVLPKARGAGANTSLDYPGLASTATTMYLYGNPAGVNGSGQIGNITNRPGSPDPARLSGTGDQSTRTVYPDPVQMQVRVPRYQPANLQIWDDTSAQAGTGGRKGPENINTSNYEYPMGYSATGQYVYVDSNHNHQYDDGEAYRSIQTFTGVPVDMTTTIESPTTDLGVLPQSFGVQTDGYTGLQTFKNGSLTELGFQPYNNAFAPFFKSLTILNRGNTNWLNIHLDQKVNTTGQPSALPLNSAALEPLVTIPAYDYSGIAGPQTSKLGSTTVVEQPYLLRSSLDPDLVTAFGRNPGLSASYPGATFSKARVSAGTPTQLRVPEAPNVPGTTYLVPTLPFNQPLAGYSALPFVGLAVPLGTPVGTYSQNLRLFEGMDTNNYASIYGTTTYKRFLPPKYGGQVINPTNATPPTTTGATSANLNDAFTLSNGIPLQPYSTATVIKGTVTEARMTDGLSFGALPQIDTIDPAATTNVRVVGPDSSTDRLPAADFLPSAFADPATDALSLYWTSSRHPTTAIPYNVYGVNLTKTGVAFTPSGTFPSWWIPVTGLPISGANSGINVVHDQVLPSGGGFDYDSKAYAFVQSVLPSGPTYTDTLNCYQVTPATGAIGSSAVQVLQNTGQVINGVRGLKFKAATLPNGGFTDPLGGTTTIKNDLWAFWYGGTRGRSAIYYTSALSANVDSPTATPPFGTPAVLPVPAGLTSVSDPSAIVTYAPDASGNEIPVIEVTYTGIAPDGNADIYISRYRPYYVQTAAGTATTQIGLALVAAPTITEQMQADTGLLYYQARDVAWTRPTANSGFEVFVYNNPLGLATYFKAPVYDRASGTLIYTRASGSLSLTAPSGINNPTLTSPTPPPTINTVYVDLARGRVRFSPTLPTLTYTGQDPNDPTKTIKVTVGPNVFATFSPTARRVTTDLRSDTAPVAFLDQTYKTNDLPGYTSAPRVQTDRYWFLWRKSGASGTSTTPTLWYKTQRLTIYLHDSNNNPVSLKLAAGQPSTLNLSDNNATNNISAAALRANVDVDWVRGRLYFPEVINGIPTEGHRITVTFDTVAQTGITLTDTIHWLDEPRTNDITLGQTTTGPVTNGDSASIATATGEAEIPMQTITNESSVTAFLDPLAYNDTLAGGNDSPHKVWLFWNSTRNGTADLYYETIDPLFSPVAGSP